MGRDKNWLPWDGKTFLAQVVATVAQVCSPIVLVRHKNTQKLPPLDHIDDLHVIEDNAATENLGNDNMTPGPVPAVLAGLKYLAGMDLVLQEDMPVFLTANDCPMLRAELIQQLHDRWLATRSRTSTPLAGESASTQSASTQSTIAAKPIALIPVVGERPQYLSSVISPRMREPMEGYHAAGQRSLKGIFEKVAHQRLREEDFADSDPELLSFRNVNTPEEYSAALRRYQILKPPNE